MTYINSTCKLNLLIQNLLDLLNIDNQPIPNAVLTSRLRATTLKKLSEFVNPDTIRLIDRILLAMTSEAAQKREGDSWDGEYLAISWRYIRDTCHRDTETELTNLTEQGIIEHNGYINHPDGRCKGYRIVDIGLINAYSQPITLDTPKTFLELPRSKRKQAISEIAINAEKAIPVGKMNLIAVIGHLFGKMSFDGDVTNLINESRYVFTCYLNQTNYDYETGVLTYKQYYHTTDIGGRTYGSSGDQLVSRTLKVHWTNLPNTHNYDIKGAHISIFNQLHPTQFATDWVNNIDGFRQKLADKVGVPLEMMKRSVLALTYGALPTAHNSCEIYQLFIAYFGDKMLAVEGLERFKLVTAEYQFALSTWHKDIRKNTKKYQTNALKLKTDITNAKSLASHYLQGKEQEAIIWISSLSNQRNHRYKVISNQFDGVVTVGLIPDSILTKFQDKFKLTIEIKPIG